MSGRPWQIPYLSKGLNLKFSNRMWINRIASSKDGMEKWRIEILTMALVERACRQPLPHMVLVKLSIPCRYSRALKYRDCFLFGKE
jgi:hypothetical protein